MRASLLVLSVALLSADTTTHAQQLPIVRQVSAPTATSTTKFGLIVGVRALANGGTLVNDGQNRRLVVLDAELSHPRVLLDSVSTNAQSYGPIAAPLVPFVGDSSLFVDAGANTLVVIDPSGRVVRAAAPPNSRDFIHILYDNIGADFEGNLIYRGAFRVRKPSPGGTLAVPDSAPILRANFDTRKVDTVASYRITALIPLRERTDSNGTIVESRVINPLTTIDDWVVLSGGQIAIVRGHDYHVDIIGPKGPMSSGPKLPFDFRKLTDSDRTHLIDSARIAENRKIKESLESATNFAGNTEIPILQPRSKVQRVIVNEFVPPDQLADYYPPIRPGAAKADLDNHLWILPTTSAQSRNGELVYDVVSNAGELLYRVRLPTGRSVAGFGRNGVVYLMSRDGGGWTLERVTVKQ